MNRNCDAVSLMNAKGRSLILAEEDLVIPCSEYSLLISVGPNKLTAPHLSYPEETVLKGDLTVEDLILSHFGVKTRAATETGGLDFHTALAVVEYRTEVLKNIKVISFSDIFGKEAGSDLSSLITIMPKIDHDFMVSADRDRCMTIKDGMTLYDVVSEHSFMPAFLFLKFNESLDIPSVETRFTVEVELDGGKILRDTTGVVTLTK